MIGDLADHRVERVLRLLDLTAGKGPAGLPRRRNVTGEQHPPVVDAHGVRRQPETHLGTVPGTPIRGRQKP